MVGMVYQVKKEKVKNQVEKGQLHLNDYHQILQK